MISMSYLNITFFISIKQKILVEKQKPETNSSLCSQKSLLLLLFLSSSYCLKYENLEFEGSKPGPCVSHRKINSSMSPPCFFVSFIFWNHPLRLPIGSVACIGCINLISVHLEIYRSRSPCCVCCYSRVVQTRCDSLHFHLTARYDDKSWQLTRLATDVGELGEAMMSKDYCICLDIQYLIIKSKW